MSIKKVILLIDDNEAWHPVIKDLVKDFNFDVDTHTAVNGESGIAKYKEMCKHNNKPDLVLMDIRLGDIDGREIALQMKNDDPTINVALFTFYTEDVIGHNLGLPLISKQLPAPELIRSIKNSIRGIHIV